MRGWPGSGGNVVGNELQAGSIGAENGVGAAVWDVGPPPAIENCDLRNCEGMVPEELNRLYRFDLVRLTRRAPVIRSGLP